MAPANRPPFSNMYRLFFLIASLFINIAYPGTTDLFTSDPDSLNYDAFGTDQQLMSGANDGSQLFTNDIWSGDGSNLLASNPDNGYISNLDFMTTGVDDPLAVSSNNQPLGIPPISGSEDSLSSTLLFPSDPSLSLAPDSLPGHEVSLAYGENCPISGTTSSKVRRRGLNLDWLWNQFKGPESPTKESPKVCPTSPSEEQPLAPQTETGGGGPNGPPSDEDDPCKDYTLLCCRGDFVEDSEALEMCWYCEFIRGLGFFSCGLKMCR